MQEIRMEVPPALWELGQKLQKSPQVFHELRAAAMEDAAPRAKAILDRHIGGTGKVRAWQASYVGSKGGYAAVRPKADTWTEVNGRGKRYAVGAVTNAIVSGHAFPTPSGRDKRYRPRIKSGAMRVAPRPFYEQARPEIRTLAEETGERIVKGLTEALE